MGLGVWASWPVERPHSPDVLDLLASCQQRLDYPLTIALAVTLSDSALAIQRIQGIKAFRQRACV